MFYFFNFKIFKFFVWNFPQTLAFAKSSKRKMISFKRKLASLKKKKLHPIMKKELYEMLEECFILPKYKEKTVTYQYLEGLKDGLFLTIPKTHQPVIYDRKITKLDAYGIIEHANPGFDEQKMPSKKWMICAASYIENLGMGDCEMDEFFCDENSFAEFAITLNELKDRDKKIKKKGVAKREAAKRALKNQIIQSLLNLKFLKSKIII